MDDQEKKVVNEETGLYLFSEQVFTERLYEPV